VPSFELTQQSVLFDVMRSPPADAESLVAWLRDPRVGYSATGERPNAGQMRAH